FGIENARTEARPQPPRQDPRCRAACLREEGLPRRRRRRYRRRVEDIQGRRLLSLPRQAGHLPRAPQPQRRAPSPQARRGNGFETESVARADAALLAFLRAFTAHKALGRLFMIEALGAGKEFHQRLSEIHLEFADIIRTQLDEAVRRGEIEPLNTEVAATA